MDFFKERNRKKIEKIKEDISKTAVATELDFKAALALEMPTPNIPQQTQKKTATRTVKTDGAVSAPKVERNNEKNGDAPARRRSNQRKKPADQPRGETTKATAKETKPAATDAPKSTKAVKQENGAKSHRKKDKPTGTNGEKKTPEHSVSIIPLGGMGEVGKNMTVIRYGNSMIVIDCGIMFPDDDMPGIDTIIPDYSYLVDCKKKIKAIVVTHGHEDHIGALPYVLRDLNVPVYGTRLTLGLVRHKLKEAKVNAELIEVKAKDSIHLAPFRIDFLRVNHSIADAVAVAVHTPAGVIVHTGDFKIDMTPVDGEIMDFAGFCALGEKGVLALLSDSTNAESPGFTPSESLVGATFDNSFKQCKGRIILASFATNIHRLQQAIVVAAKYNRKVAIVGRSMVNTVNIATDLGYLKIPKNTLIDIDDIGGLPPNKILVLATGSQGEPMSTLSRIANGDHKQIKIMLGDTIIISARPIPGNEISVSRNIDLLYRLGAEVIYEAEAEMHVSGHASQEEHKLMLSMVKPQYFVPVHGETRMLYKHAGLARDLGIPEENIFILDNGQILELSTGHGAIKGSVPSGMLMIDGLGSNDVGDVVLRDRRQLANDGIMVVCVTVDRNGALAADPEFITRGFIYVKEAEEIMDDTKVAVRGTMEKYEGQRIRDFTSVKQDVKEVVGKALYSKVKRKPMIIPVIIETY